MNENYLSGKCIYIYISAKYISKDVDVHYSLKKIYSPHVLKTFNNLSRDAYFSDLYVKSVSKLLRCHKTSVNVPRVYDFTQRSFPGPGVVCCLLASVLTTCLPSSSEERSVLPCAQGVLSPIVTA